MEFVAHVMVSIAALAQDVFSHWVSGTATLTLTTSGEGVVDGLVAVMNFVVAQVAELLSLPSFGP